MGIIILGLVIAGFILFKKQFSDIFKEKSNSNTTGITSQAEPLETKNNESIKKEVKEEEYIPQEEVQNLKIYYGVKGKEKIECENKRVRRNPVLIGQARQIVNSLIEDPSNERLYKLLPENLTLRGLFYNSGLFIIDFSREFNKIYSYGTSEQVLAVYSIVNSITELEPKAQVRFLINGSEPDGEEGHLDLSQKFSRLETIIEK